LAHNNADPKHMIQNREIRQIEDFFNSVGKKPSSKIKVISVARPTQHVLYKTIAKS
jgi:hypothetical protein